MYYFGYLAVPPYYGYQNSNKCSEYNMNLGNFGSFENFLSVLNENYIWSLELPIVVDASCENWKKEKNPANSSLIFLFPSKKNENYFKMKRVHLNQRNYLNCPECSTSVYRPILKTHIINRWLKLSIQTVWHLNNVIYCDRNIF